MPSKKVPKKDVSDKSERKFVAKVPSRSVRRLRKQRPKPATDFPMFNMLPAELRLKIWSYAYPNMRTGVVEFHYPLLAPSYITKPTVLWNHVLPIMLSCREAFALMNGRYFAKDKIAIDMSKSILYLNSDINRWGSLTTNLPLKVIQLVEAVAVNVSVWIDSYATKLVQDLRLFPNLKKLYLIRADGQSWNWGAEICLGEKDIGSKISKIVCPVIDAEMAAYPELSQVRAAGFDVYFAKREQN